MSVIEWDTIGEGAGDCRLVVMLLRVEIGFGLKLYVLRPTYVNKDKL